ncbi:hypothetical protein [Haloferula sargassicola]|uniref:Uncharacterized protein n=1 Tax=Haloferula sargassicola TaxID=490096 RepID=A0ABP9UT04_9BACT
MPGGWCIACSEDLIRSRHVEMPDGSNPISKMLRFLPWRLLLKYAARRYGMLDPLTLMARLRSFAQPSEVAEPIELLRAGMVFHARGLVNAKAIQHNLDWVWPFWVERQFNPSDPSFVPRAFSFSHINLTHRNWTALGTPDLPLYPLVDPRGLVTPLYDGWSIDFWILPDEGPRLLPSKLSEDQVQQQLQLDPDLAVHTHCQRGGLRLSQTARLVDAGDGLPELKLTAAAAAEMPGWLAVAIRPYNPEGIQFVHEIAVQPDRRRVRVNDEATLAFDREPDAIRMARYEEGDVSLHLKREARGTGIDCEVGLATLAALFRIEPGQPTSVDLRVDLPPGKASPPPAAPIATRWERALAPTARLRIPDERMRFLYDAAVRTLLMLSADDYFPGPYTYRRFWFRDACLMLQPLLAIGLDDRAERILSGFPSRQTLGGYFSSQEGEWDSNGQVLWISALFQRFSGRRVPADLNRALRKAVDWLRQKRLPATATRGTAGLLPAGFSAEHLGPNDFYYWDDFWALGGLRAMAAEWRRSGETEAADEAAELADEFEADLRDSIATIPDSRSLGGIPAAPGRRMDAGAVGSMVADYPLRLHPPGDPKIMRTLEFLLERSFHRGGFFQDMIHSGINAYLTLDLAQTLLRAGDPRFAELVRTVADLASPTGQWPEAIHPNTLGGCMGDGQHGWAAAEWIMMMRNCFVREEDEALVIGAGLLPEWLENEAPLEFGPTSTPWGKITVRLADGKLRIEGAWRDEPPALQVRVPGFQPLDLVAGTDPIELTPA